MFSFLKKLFNVQKTDTNPVKEDQRMKLESNHDHISRLIENITTIKDNDLDKSCKSNESYQKVELNKCNDLYSNETASSSSETIAHESFDDQINTTYKSQRKCSRLAAKKIKKVVEELSASYSDDSNDVIDEISPNQKIISNDCLNKSLHDNSVRKSNVHLSDARNKRSSAKVAETKIFKILNMSSSSESDEDDYI